jgi:hypothetical protein
MPMKDQKKTKTDYPFGCNQIQWDALREDAKNLILNNQRAYAKIIAANKTQSK